MLETLEALQAAFHGAADEAPSRQQPNLIRRRDGPSRRALSPISARSPILCVIGA
jgi:hypothetical protein